MLIFYMKTFQISIILLSVFCSVYSFGQQESRVVLPCSATEYSSDRIYFRATGTGSHPNLRTADRMARLDANANLAAAISVTVESVSNRYIAEVVVGDRPEMIERFEELTRSVVDRQLSKVKVVCDEVVFENGTYTKYLAVEVPNGDVLNNISEDMSGSESPLLDDKKRFEQIFNEEMERLEKE